MIKLYDSELNIMETLWREGQLTAKQLVNIMKEQVGWSRTTTYTIIKKLVDKGAVQRDEPDFICRALISREQAQRQEVDQLIDRMFDGSPGLLVNTLLGRGDLPDGLSAELRKIVDELDTTEEVGE